MFKEIYNFIILNYQLIIIPIGSAIIGWLTNVIAIKMTFYPLNYFGLRPFGWQGIIPAKAPRMATKAIDLMTDKLLDIKQVFSKIQPECISKNMEKSVEVISKQILNEVMMAQIPIIWTKLPNSSKNTLYKKIIENLPQSIELTMSDVKENINELIDLKKITYDALIEDKALINRIFLNVGKAEFRFIEVSGLYFGFLFGIIQAIIVFYYNGIITYLAGGLIVGYLTNYLAIKLIFKPTKPINLGFIKIQGLFLKRQKEVAREYSYIITNKILTIEKIYDDIFKNNKTSKIKEIVKNNLSVLIDKTISSTKIAIDIIIPKSKLENMKNIAVFRFLEEIPIALRDTYKYSEEALDLENTIRTKMETLPSEDFISFLRPVFQEDEFKLIIVGAILGGIAGFIQYLI